MTAQYIAKCDGGHSDVQLCHIVWHCDDQSVASVAGADLCIAMNLQECPV